MSDAAIANIVTGVITIVGMVIGFWTLMANNLANAKVAAEAAAKTAVTIDKNRVTLAETAKTVETVHELTNSGMAEVKKELESARHEIRELQAIALRKEEAKNVELQLKAAQKPEVK